MEKNLYIVRCGEVALKGMNRPYFERVLLERVRSALSVFNDVESRWIGGLMLVRVPADVPREEVVRVASKVFGVATVSPATCCVPDMDAIGKAAAAYMMELIEKEGIKSFKVKAKRVTRRFRCSLRKSAVRWRDDSQDLQGAARGCA